MNIKKLSDKINMENSFVKQNIICIFASYRCIYVNTYI